MDYPDPVAGLLIARQLEHSVRCEGLEHRLTRYRSWNTSRCISALIAGTEGWCVAGTASTGEELVAAECRADPDIVVTDLRMPGLPVIEAIRRLRAERPERGKAVVKSIRRWLWS